MLLVMGCTAVGTGPDEGSQPAAQRPRDSATSATATMPPRPVAPPEVVTDTRSNVVLIVADDMRFDGLWVMSSLLGLAAERGVTFERNFVTTPLCCPSRATILTGLYAHHHGVLKNDPPQGGVEAFDDRSTLATWLRDAGIRTGLVGRYLNGYDQEETPPGWSSWFALWQYSERNGNYFNFRVSDQGEKRYFDGKPESYSTRVLGQAARRFVAEEPVTPFWLYLAPRTPHSPATPDPLDLGIFKDRELPLPPSYDEEDVGDKPAWVRENGRLRKNELDEIENLRRRQLESLVGLDREIGALADALRADGRLDRTWFIFTSDNGLLLGEHRLDPGKSCAYEECARVPLVVIPPPGAVPGAARTDEHLVANIDLAPTIADIMGVGPACRSTVAAWCPCSRFPPRLGATRSCSRHGAVGRKAVRGLAYGGPKLVDLGGDDELYHLSSDPYELRNLASAQEHAAERSRLTAHLHTLRSTPPGQEPPHLP